MNFIFLAVMLIMAVFPFGGYAFYGVNYGKYLPLENIASLWLFCLSLVMIPDRFLKFSKTALLSVFAVLCFSMVFFSTKIHVFCGDGGVGPYEATYDFPNLFHFKRLDDWTKCLITKLFYGLDLKSVDCLFSFFFHKVDSWVFGFMTAILMLWHCLKNKTMIFLPFLSMPWIFNFFGNLDAYAFSVFFSVVFAVAASEVFKHNGFWKCCGLSVLWGIGLWTHPLHLFFGFIVAAAWCEYFNWKKWPLLSLYAIAFFVFIECSEFSSQFFVTNAKFVPAMFSSETLIHWANNLFWPFIPLFVLAVFMKNKWPVLVYLLSSIIFMGLAFTIGTVDQFNYQQVACMFSMFFFIELSRSNVTESKFYKAFFCNLFILIPLVCVHSSELTIKRAFDLYPRDICHHNRVMSWQTHLGLVLMDNVQPSTEIKKATLQTFYDGANHAEPAGFRFANYVYFVGAHYNFGEFEKGRLLLKDLLTRYPQSVMFFMNERPAFIYKNRDKLFEDLLEVFPYRNENDKISLKVAVEKAKSNRKIYANWK